MVSIHGDPQNGLFLREIPLNWMIYGYTISGNPHVFKNDVEPRNTEAKPGLNAAPLGFHLGARTGRPEQNADESNGCNGCRAVGPAVPRGLESDSFAFWASSADST